MPRAPGLRRRALELTSPTQTHCAVSFVSVKSRCVGSPPLPERSEDVWDWTSARSRCLREARRVLRDHHDAEEAVQEALVRAWRRRDSCQSRDEPLPWLLQITRN